MTRKKTAGPVALVAAVLEYLQDNGGEEESLR